MHKSYSTAPSLYHIYPSPGLSLWVSAIISSPSDPSPRPPSPNYPRSAHFLFFFLFNLLQKEGRALMSESALLLLLLRGWLAARIAEAAAPGAEGRKLLTKRGSISPTRHGRAQLSSNECIFFPCYTGRSAYCKKRKRRNWTDLLILEMHRKHKFKMHLNTDRVSETLSIFRTYLFSNFYLNLSEQIMKSESGERSHTYSVQHILLHHFHNIRKIEPLPVDNSPFTLAFLSRHFSKPFRAAHLTVRKQAEKRERPFSLFLNLFLLVFGWNPSSRARRLLPPLPLSVLSIALSLVRSLEPTKVEGRCMGGWQEGGHQTFAGERRDRKKGTSRSIYCLPACSWERIK